MAMQRRREKHGALFDIALSLISACIVYELSGVDFAALAFAACMMLLHEYREYKRGCSDWVEIVVIFVGAIFTAYSVLFYRVLFG